MCSAVVDVHAVQQFVTLRTCGLRKVKRTAWLVVAHVIDRCMVRVVRADHKHMRATL